MITGEIFFQILSSEQQYFSNAGRKFRQKDQLKSRNLSEQKKTHPVHQ